MRRTTICLSFILLSHFLQTLVAQTWDDAFPDVQGWRKAISGAPSIVESRADGPGLLVSGTWSNLNGAKLDQDGQTANATPAAEFDNSGGSDWDGGTEWLVARGFHFNIPPDATIKAISFAFRWSVDGGVQYGCSINLYNFGVLKQNAFIPYAYRWYQQVPYVPPSDSQFDEWWPWDEQIGFPGESGIWSSNADVGFPDWDQGNLWMTTWNPSDINDPGFGAGFSTDFPWSCDGDPTNIHVDAIRMAVYFTGSGPMISGPDAVWAFNGENPSNYPTSITLTSDGGEGTIWGVTAGAEKVNINPTGSTVTVTSTGCCFSSSVDDVQITAQSNFQTSSPFHLTTRTPYQLVPLGPSYACDMDYGYDVKIYYKIQDQLLTDLPTPIGVNEDWTTQVIPDYIGTDWERGPLRNTTTDPGSQFYDDIQGERAGRTPDSYCQGALGSKVEHWGQIFRVGSTTTGAGTEVQVDTLQKFENDADHEGIGR